MQVFLSPYIFTITDRLDITEKDIAIEGIKHSHKDTLIDTITNRVETRIKQGAVAELTSLINQGYDMDDPGMKTIGCQQLKAYIEGHCTLEQAKNDWIIKETQYAKRQDTFMKKDPHIRWTFMA